MPSASDQGLSTQPLADGVEIASPPASPRRGHGSEVQSHSDLISHACSVGLQMETGVARLGELWTVDC